MNARKPQLPSYKAYIEPAVVADIIGIPASMVRELMKAGEIKFETFGRQKLVLMSELAKLSAEALSAPRQPTKQPAQPSGERLIRLPAVLEMIGMRKSGIYKFIREGRFPAPISLGGKRAVAWPESVVQDWINERILLAGRTK